MVGLEFIDTEKSDLIEVVDDKVKAPNTFHRELKGEYLILGHYEQVDIVAMVKHLQEKQ